jgi:hypothetical protein
MSHGKSALLIVVIATICIASAWAPLAIGSRRLHIQPLPSAELPIRLIEPVIAPSATQERGIVTLSRLNDLLAAGSLVVTFCALLVLSFARASSRRNEILVRRAVGASRKRLLLDGLYEGGLMALAVVVLGSVLGLMALRFATSTWPGTVDAPGLLGPSWLLVAIGLTIVLGVLLPLKSLGTMRPALPPLAPLLAPAICALQLASCFTVLVQARQVKQEALSLAGGVTAGEREGRVFQLEIPTSPAERSRQLLELIQGAGLSDLFDVASLSSPGALEGLGTVNMTIIECGACYQGGIATPLRPVAVSLSIVSADTFRALNTQLIEGRWITDKDNWKAKRVAVVSQGLAREHCQNGEAIGRRIHLGQGDDDIFTVVGVVTDRKLAGLGGALQPGHSVYASVLQLPPTSVDFLARPHRRIDWSSVPSWLPVGSLKGSMPEERWRAMNAAPIRWFGTALLLGSASVVFVALLGIAFSMSIWVGGMLPELAIHRCVGSRRWDVLKHVVYRTSGVVAAGLVLGVLVAELTAGPLSAVSGGVNVFDLTGELQVALLVVGVTALGVSLPAWRARTLEPIVLLSRHGE